MEFVIFYITMPNSSAHGLARGVPNFFGACGGLQLWPQKPDSQFLSNPQPDLRTAPTLPTTVTAGYSAPPSAPRGGYMSTVAHTQGVFIQT